MESTKLFTGRYAWYFPHQHKFWQVQQYVLLHDRVYTCTSSRSTPDGRNRLDVIRDNEWGTLYTSDVHESIVVLFADVDGYNYCQMYILVKYSIAIEDNLQTLVYMDNIALKWRECETGSMYVTTSGNKWTMLCSTMCTYLFHLPPSECW